MVLVIDIGVFISADSFSAKREKPVEEADRPGRDIDSLIFTSRSQSFVLPTQRMARVSDLSSDLSMVILDDLCVKYSNASFWGLKIF